jgi:hypothetical protein
MFLEIMADYHFVMNSINISLAISYQQAIRLVFENILYIRGRGDRHIRGRGFLAPTGLGIKYCASLI